MKLEFPYFDGTNWNWYQVATESFVNAKIFNINSNTSGQLNISRLNNYPNSTNAFLRGDGTWTLPLINNLSINGDVLLGIYNLYTSGNLGAIGVLYANSFSSYNTGNISVVSPMNFNFNRITNLPDPINIQDPLTLNYFNNNNNLKATQTLTSASVSFNWPLGAGVYTTYFNHYLLDTSPLTASSPSFFETIQSGTGSTKRSWQIQFSPGTSNLPTGSFSLWYQHNSFTGSYANGFSPFSLDYNNSSSTPSFIANFSGSLITSLSITTLSGGIITAKINSYNSNNTIDMSSNTLINILNGVNANDAVNVSQLTSNITNTVFLGTGAITLVKGTTAQRPTGVNGMIRWNSTLSQYEGYTGSAWVSFFTATATAYSELQGLSVLNTTGLIARTASGTYTSRTLTTTTGTNSISIANGSGVSGNPQISLSSTAGINTTGNIGCGDVIATGQITAPNVNTNALAPSTNSTITTGALNITAGVNATFNFGFLNSSGTTGTSSGTNTYSVLATYRIKASEFNAVSSIKKKHVLDDGVEVETEVINIIKNTEFFKYEYIDQITEKGIRYGIIAEELAKTLPDYVDYDNMEYIPNIMQKGKLTQIAGGINNCKYILKLKDKIKISNEAKKLKLVDENNKVIEALILNVINEKTLEIKTEDRINRMKKTVFVYGTYEQCPSVASKVTELALIAVKNLLTRIEILEKRIYE